LNPNVALRERYEASKGEHVILRPHGLLFHFLPLLLKEEYLGAASGDQDLIVDEIHLPQVHVGHGVSDVFGEVVGVNVYVLALSIKAIDLLELFIIKALVGEVLERLGINFDLNWLANNLSYFEVKHEMIVC